MSELIVDGNWAQRPAAVDLPDAWKILRTPARGFTAALCLSEDTEGAYCHYWGGRTRLCLKRDCEPCACGNVARWRGYVAVLIGPSRMTRLLELTPSTIPAIERYLAEWKTLRGSIISCSRKGRKENGELELIFAEKPVSGANLPACPPVAVHVCRIWRTTHTAKPAELACDASTELRRSGFELAYDAERESGLGS
jgi:hypothetical protein